MSYRRPFLIALLGLLPFFLLAQSLPKINAAFNKTRLGYAFSQLETKYSIFFSYEDELVDKIQVTARLRQLSLDKAMEKLLEGTELGFEIMDGQHVLIKKRNAPANRETPPPPSLITCGKVLDGITSEPLIGATIFIKKTQDGCYTDTLGEFRLKGDFAETDTLQISYIGYDDLHFTVADFTQRPCQSIDLRYSGTWMSDIIVKDFSIDMLQLANDGHFHFKKEKIPTLPGWGEPDVLRMLQLLPGIGSAEESAARINVRGGTPDQNLILWEGIPMYHTGHFFGLYDVFNPYIVDEVNVWRGNFGAEHGGRNSSVIDITGRPELVDESTWNIGFNLLHSNIFMEKPLFRKKEHKRGAIIVAGRSSLVNSKTRVSQEFFDQVFQRGRVALQESDGSQDESTTWNPTFDYGDFNIKLRWQGKRKNDNAFSINSSSDELNYFFEKNTDSTYFSTNDFIMAQNVGLSWQHTAQWKPHLKANAVIAISTYSNNFTYQVNTERDSAFTYRYQTSNFMNDLSFNFKVDWQLDERKNLLLGYHLNGQQSDLVYQDTNVLKQEKNIFSRDTSILGTHTLYTSYEVEHSDKFQYTLGMRLNVFPLRKEKLFAEPRLSFVWQPSADDHLSVKGSLSSTWQFVFQIVDFTDLGVGEPLWALAKDSIPAQRSTQLTLGASYETKSMLIDGEFYLKGSENLTSRNLLVDQGFEKPLSFDGQALAVGFDFLFRKRIPPYSMWFAYSLGQVNQQFSELNNGRTYPARHDIRHQINWVHTLEKGRWNFSTNFHFRTGTPYSIPDVEQVPCPQCTESDFTHVLSFERLNTERLPNTIRVDVSSTYTFGKKNKKWKLGFSVLNLFNRKNILDKDFVLETPNLNQSQEAFELKELDRFAAGAAPNFFVQYEW